MLVRTPGYFLRMLDNIPHMVSSHLVVIREAPPAGAYAFNLSVLLSLGINPDSLNWYVAGLVSILSILMAQMARLRQCIRNVIVGSFPYLQQF